MQPQNMPFWYIGYFELKLLKKQLVQERLSDPPLSPRKQEISLSCESYTPCTKRMKGTLITRDRTLRGEKAL